jgi:DivIVA domain-containing protein
MMWVLGVLIICVIGGVAVVAAGGGAPLSESYDDRRDVLVPEHGPLTPEDLTTIEFSTVFRGYRATEVDALLDRLAAQIAELQPARPADEPAPSPDPLSTASLPALPEPGDEPGIVEP